MGTINPTKKQSPCVTCTRVPNPNDCENKLCQPWKRWFLARWAEIHAYAQHNAVIKNLSNDPCDKCVCFGKACTGPCRIKQIWQEEQIGKPFDKTGGYFDELEE